MWIGRVECSCDAHGRYARALMHACVHACVQRQASSRGRMHPCPHAGALMLLFQSEVWGSLLHTGDCRLTPDALHELKVGRGSGACHIKYSLFMASCGM